MKSFNNPIQSDGDLFLFCATGNRIMRALVLGYQGTVDIAAAGIMDPISLDWAVNCPLEALVKHRSECPDCATRAATAISLSMNWQSDDVLDTSDLVNPLTEKQKGRLMSDGAVRIGLPN